MRARAQITVPGRTSDAEALWYDTHRWAAFVDGFDHVERQAPGWPAEGILEWASTPGGRGRVRETVVRFEPRVGQTAEFEDEKTTGTQTIAFAVTPQDRVRVTLELAYDLKERRGGPLFSVIDALFIRPRQREALARTLGRFSRELEAGPGA